MRIKILALGFIFIFIIACAKHLLYYNIVLSEVERPVEGKVRYGKQKIIKTDEQGYAYLFEDEIVKVFWLHTCSIPHLSKLGFSELGFSKLEFRIINKTEDSIKIIWDKAAYVDEHGESRRVVRSSVNYTNKFDPQPPSIVVGKED